MTLKIKILIILVTLFFLSLVGFILRKDFQNQGITPVPAPVIKEKIKGCWEIQDINNLVNRELERLKEDGINTITFSPPLDQKKDSDINEPPFAEKITKMAINKLHRAGIRVMLEPSPMGPEAAPRAGNLKKFQRRMKEITLRYAEIAQRYQVEYFSPLAEAEHHMGLEAAEKWMREILPEVRKRYQGKVMWKKTGADLSLAESGKLRYDINFEGFDYIVLDVFREGTDPTRQEHIDYVRKLIENTKVQAKADGVPQVILGEFGGTILPLTHESGRYLGDYQKKRSTPMTNKELAETTRAVLELAENMVDGYIYGSCSMEGRGITVIPEVEEVIKEWFTQISEKCGIESCHGLDITCGPNVPQVCDMMYKAGDNCRQFVTCKFVSGKCRLEKTAKFDSCKSCVERCESDYKDDQIKFFECESKCAE